MKRLVLLLGMVGCSGIGPESTTKPGTVTDTSDGSGTHTAEGDGGDAGADTADSGSTTIEEGCTTMTNPGGLGAVNCVRQAGCQWDGAQYYGNLGHAIDIGGDIDGDGLADWVVGAPYEDEMAGEEVGRLDVGIVHIFRGAERSADATPSAQLLGTKQASSLGYSVVIAPDLNGDGLDDVVAGGNGRSTDTIIAAGEVQILFGRADGWDDPALAADVTWVGEQEMARAGSTVHGVGDTNGDGLGELAVATNLRQTSAAGYEQPGQGMVALFHGQADFAEISGLADASAHIAGVGSADGAGMAIASGDLDGDGYQDLIIGAPYGATNNGRVVIFPGSATGTTGDLTLDDAPLQFTGDNYSDTFGYTLAAGDLNADGIAELVIGSPTADDATPESGTVRVYAGSADFFAAATEPIHTVTGEWDDHQLGMGLAAGADVNGDGVGDLIMGAIGAWQGLVTKGGRVYVEHGPHTDWTMNASASEAPVQFYGGATKDYIGKTLDAADLNGDGKAELMISTGYANVGSNFDAGRIYLFWGE